MHCELIDKNKHIISFVNVLIGLIALFHAC